MPTRIPTQIPRVQRSKLAQEIARLKRELTMLTDDPDYAGKNEQIAEARHRVRSLKDKSTQLMDELSAIDKDSEKQQARPPPPPPPPPPTLRALSPHPILSIPSQHPPLVPFSPSLTLSLPLSSSPCLSPLSVPLTVPLCCSLFLSLPLWRPIYPSYPSPRFRIPSNLLSQNHNRIKADAAEKKAKLDEEVAKDVKLRKVLGREVDLIALLDHGILDRDVKRVAEARETARVEMERQARPFSKPPRPPAHTVSDRLSRHGR